MFLFQTKTNASLQQITALMTGVASMRSVGIDATVWKATQTSKEHAQVKTTLGYVNVWKSIRRACLHLRYG